MPAIKIDGKLCASRVRGEIKQKADALQAKGINPCLAVVLVGSDPASQSYVTAKSQACKENSIKALDYALAETTSEVDLIELLKKLNSDETVHGILVQLPLPKHINEDRVLSLVSPEKDVDGFHPVNVGLLALGKPSFYPCTPHGVIKLLEQENISTSGKNVVVLGRSNIVGKPMANLLLQKGKFADATVTICHSKTENLTQYTLSADIIIAAIGRPQFLTKEMIKPGAVVIDVGVNRIPDASKKSGYRLVGDSDENGMIEKASYYTPVPGGVGPMTITMLLYNTVEAASARHSK